VASRKREDGVVSAFDYNKAGQNINFTAAPYKVYNIGNSSPVQLMEYI